MLITTAYGQILPQAVLDIAKINNINLNSIENIALITLLNSKNIEI